jgi:hypothetical protein
MSFQVFVQSHGQEPEAVSGQLSAKGALRLMGSYIRGKRFSIQHAKVYAVGSRYGWTYTQRELASLVSYQPAIRRLAEDVKRLDRLHNADIINTGARS